MCGNADAEVFRHGLCVSGGTSVSPGQLCGRTEPSRVLRLGWAGPGRPCSMLVPALGVGDEGSMGRRNADRVPRVGFLRGGPPGSIRMATYETCGHEAPLPVEAIIKRHGKLKWPHSPGQVGGEDKLSPGCDYAASFRFDAVAKACPGNGVEPIPRYASSGVRPANAEWGRRVL